MKIKFSDTSQNHQGQIEYYNVRGQIVKTYPLSALELWIIKQDLLNTGEIEEIAECGNPFSRHYKLVESPIYEDLNTYIDDNWVDVCEQFYSAMNPIEFKSQNTEQQTRRVA